MEKKDNELKESFAHEIKELDDHNKSTELELKRLNGELQSGIDTLLELANFKEIIKDKDYIITGEGSFDNQSLNGKVISGILKYVDKNKLVIILWVYKKLLTLNL